MLFSLPQAIVIVLNALTITLQRQQTREASNATVSASSAVHEVTCETFFMDLRAVKSTRAINVKAND